MHLYSSYPDARGCGDVVDCERENWAECRSNNDNIRPADSCVSFVDVLYLFYWMTHDDGFLETARLLAAYAKVHLPTNSIGFDDRFVPELRHDATTWTFDPSQWIYEG